jgi:hypothetical protein
MRASKRCFAVFLFVAWAVASVPLHAAPIGWELFGVTFSDGASASGTFTYDAGVDLYSAWNIVVTPGILTAYDYQLGLMVGSWVSTPPGRLTLWPSHRQPRADKCVCRSSAP